MRNNNLKRISNINTREMTTNNIKQSPTINGYTAVEDWDALTLIKLLWKKEQFLKINVKKFKRYTNEINQVENILKALYVKDPKHLTFSKEQLFYLSNNLHLFKPQLKVIYTYCEGMNNGRVYPACSLGFATTRKQIRHTFCRDKYVDIDIANAHCNVLNQMYEGRYETLNDYCERRPYYYEQLQKNFAMPDGQKFLTDEDICKSYFIICGLYGGTWDAWCADNGLPSGVAPPEFHHKLMEELRDIYQDLLPQHSELAMKLNNKKDWNLEGSLISWVCQEQERKILEAMVDFATKEKLIPKTKKDRNLVLIYDGFQLPINAKITPLWLRKMENFIEEQTGYRLKLTMKPFDKGFTDEELDFEITEPVKPPEVVVEIDYVALLGEFLDLPEKKEEQVVLCETLYGMIEDCIRNKTEVKIARMIKELYQGKIVYAGDGVWYMFENKSWIRDDKDATRSVISNKTYKVFEKITKYWLGVETEDEELTKEIANRIKTLTSIQLKLESTTDKNNIYKEMKEVCLKADFSKEFNLAKNVLPIKNGLLLNLTNNTTRERTIADKFDYECPVDFVKNTENGKTYLNAIFCDDVETLKVFCNVIKSCVSGRNLRKVYICSGSGRNGKSLLFKKMKKAFGKGMDTLSSKLFIESKKGASVSSLNTECEKLDKIRIGFISEIEDEDTLNRKAIKGISGGDEINLRTLFKTDITIYPTANLFMCVNIEPKFEAEEALNDRLVNFPFNAKFNEDASYEEKVDGWLSEIFSYIMTTGELIEVLVPSPAMIAKKEEHQNAQVDSLKEFIADRINIVPDESKKITNNDFYKDYVSWCKINHQSYPGVKVVSRRITSFNIKKKESNGKTQYYGLEFKQENDVDTDTDK